MLTVNRWSAVARGAAVGLRISTRTSRRHYGTVCDVPFIHGKHPVGNLYKCPFTGIMYCANTMAWFINEVKAQDIQATDKYILIG